ncbi:MAG: T9SS type A sorting domain-containing protein [Bacteroidia bacterium]|nr:T9SS type A sorting domain-containing protein [Bacteroidia bacterium]
MITATTTTPTWTINPCFYNLCNGNYTILINGVADNDACMICNINMMFPPPPTTGLNAIGAKEYIALKISPNPAKEQVKISYNLESMNDAEAHIINLLGQKLKKITTQKDASSTICNISDLGPGIYFIAISNKDKILERKKLIISD